MLVKERPIPGRLDGRLSVFLMCQAMEFKHLPMPGGVFAQHPGLMDAFVYVWQQQSAEEERKKQKEKNSRMGSSRPPRRR